MWGKRGRDDYILVSPAIEAEKRERARRYWQKHGLAQNSLPPRPANLKPEDPEYQDYLAAKFIHFYDYCRKLTNFPHHYHKAEIELQPETIQARKAFFEAEQHLALGRRDLARERYEGKDALAAWRKLMLKYEILRTDEYILSDTYEVQLNYVTIIQDLRGRLFKNLLVTQHFLGQGAAPAGAARGWSALTHLVLLNQMPMPEVNPETERRFDTPGPDGEPMIPEDVIREVKVRRGLMKPRQPTPEEMAQMRMPPAGMPAPPGMEFFPRPIPPPQPTAPGAGSSNQ
jgi:hypothetical protein